MKTNIFDELNDKQREAVLYMDNPLLILAGAGTGKTKTLVHKLACLVDRGLTPRDIVMLTFTNKAADEMKSRAEKFCNVSMKGMFIGTFHSICTRILKIELPYDFVIYDGSDQKTLIKNILKELNVDIKKNPPSRFLNIISKAKCNFMPLDSIGDGLVKKVYKKYEERLREGYAFDFDDLLLNVITLFQKPEIREKYENKFRYVLVDEFHDTNLPQYELIKFLSLKTGKVCVVGDEDQSIYSWRGARVDNMQRFVEDFSAHIIKLERNYRSTKPILNLANKVISCNKERIGKALFTEKDSDDMPYVRIFFCREEEIKFVVSCIKKEKDLNETAMLYRNQYLSRLLERELILERIPYRLLGGVGFFERKEIKDILSFMRILVNDGDGVSFLRSASCIPHIGEKTCLQVERLVREEKISYIEAASRQKKKEMKNYAHIMKKLQEAIYKKGKIGNFFKELFQQTEYLEQLKNDEERKRNIREFTDYAISSMEGEGLTVKDFLNNIALLGYKRNRLRDEKDAVNLTTIHSAKGLEFDTVFIIDVDEGILPSKRSLEEGIYSSSLEEERRLLYVAITRARKKVFILSGGRPSVFIREIGKRQNIRWL